MIIGFPPAARGPAAVEFRCPGEPYTISRSIHLARLAAGYPKCRNCPHRPGGALEPDATAINDDADCHAVPGARDLFTDEGVRGIYLNELSRQTAAELAGAFASCLWDEIPAPEPATPRGSGVPEDGSPEAADDSGSVRLLSPRAAGPIVVVGHDERTCAPDLVMGVALALRRMGCQVVDVGLTTRPCFWFAVEHLQAIGGVYVTGAGFGPAWSGLDFARKGAVPCSRGGTLDTIAARFRAGYPRVSRRAGALRSFAVDVPYEAGLWKHFHALRPLRVAFGCPSRAVRDRFARVFHKLACRLLPVEVPVRERSDPEHDDTSLARVAAAVRKQQAHFGLLVDDDGQRTVFLDEAGAPLTGMQATSLFVGLLAEEFPGRALVVARPASKSSSVVGSAAAGARHFECEPSLEGCAAAMRRHQAVFGASGGGHYWFYEGFPTCDAIVTVARLLQVLSRSDTPLSEVAARANLLSPAVV
jgi:phosphomannomutase